MRFDRRGFTLIELIIVVIIIGILAAIAAPMMVGNVDRAKRTEAVAALGSIRTAERLYMSENPSSYTSVASSAWATGNLKAYINDVSLNGRYYNATDYYVNDAGATDFNAGTTRSYTSTVIMNAAGNITGG